MGKEKEIQMNSDRKMNRRKRNFNGNKFNELRDISFAIANAGEEAGLVRWFRYAFEVFIELVEG